MEKEYHKLTIKPVNPDINVIEDPTGDCHRLTSKTNTLTVSHREQPTEETINFILGTYKKGDKGDDGKSAYEAYIEAGGTLSETDFNTALSNVPEHIEDETIHHTIEELNEVYEPKNSNIQSHISDSDIHHTFDQIRDNLGINEETGSDTKYLDEKGEFKEITIGSSGYSAHVYATTIDSDIAGYKKSSNTAESSETVISTTLSNSTVLVEEYIYDAPVGITQIPNGSWRFTYYAKIGSVNPQGAKLRFSVYTRGITGTETLLFTKDTPTFTNTDYIQVLPIEFIGDLYTCLATDRIVFKVSVVTTSVPSVTVSYIVGDGRGLYVDSPLQIRHSGLREKNEEAAYQHVDSTTDLPTEEVIDEANDKLAFWNFSAIKYINVGWTRLKTWIGSYFLKLDQTTPQTLTDSPIINTLVAGQLTYIDSSKKIVTIPVYWDISQANMGLGAAPINNAKLYIFSSTTTDTLLLRGGDGLARIKAHQNAAFDTLSASGVYYFAAGASGSIQFGKAGTYILHVVNTTGNVGIGTNAPKSKLQVAGGIQCGDDTAAASADKVGTTRYRTSGNNSYYEVCMQTGASTYTWVVIKVNSW